jgi:DNA-binding MarR family transcriptional regulator
MEADTLSPAICNCAAMRQAARHVTRYYDGCLAGIGLRITQYVILSRLGRGGAMTMAQLAATMAMDRSTLGHNLRPLERDGLVAIAPDAADRRARAVTLTEAGRRKVADAQDAWHRAQAGFEAKFGAERARALRAMMAEIVAVDLAA